MRLVKIMSCLYNIAQQRPGLEEANKLETITTGVVEAARNSLVIGIK